MEPLTSPDGEITRYPESRYEAYQLRARGWYAAAQHTPAPPPRTRADLVAQISALLPPPPKPQEGETHV